MNEQVNERRSPIQGCRVFTVSLDEPAEAVPLGVLSAGDREEVSYRLLVNAAGRAVDCREAGVTVYMIRSDRQTLVWPGTGDEKGVCFSVPEEAHAVKGCFTLAVRLTLDGVRHTVFTAEGVVRESATDSLLEAGHAVPSLDELLAMLVQLEQKTGAADAAVARVDLALGMLPTFRLDEEGDVVVSFA